MPVAVSTTINMGDVVKLSSNTAVQAIAVPSTDNTVTQSGGNLGQIGLAMDGIVTNSAGVDPQGRSSIPVLIWDGNLEVTLPIVGADGALTASQANTTQGDINFGTSYNLANVRLTGAANYFYAISAGSPTNGELRKVENSPTTTATEAFGAVIVRAVISDTVRQL
jgi:hypothetical protein